MTDATFETVSIVDYSSQLFDACDWPWGRVLFVCLFACLFVCLLACLFVCLLVCLLACLFVCLFFQPFFGGL